MEHRSAASEVSIEEASPSRPRPCSSPFAICRYNEQTSADPQSVGHDVEALLKWQRRSLK